MQANNLNGSTSASEAPPPSSSLNPNNSLGPEVKMKNPAKKSGKPPPAFNNPPITNTPPDPKTFFKEYNQTVYRNAQIDWLNSQQKLYKEPSQEKIIKDQPKDTKPIAIPSFWQANQQLSNVPPSPPLANATRQPHQSANSSGSTVQLEPIPNITQPATNRQQNFKANFSRAKSQYNAALASKNEPPKASNIKDPSPFEQPEDIEAQGGRYRTLESFQQSDPFSNINHNQAKNSINNLPQAAQLQSQLTSNQTNPTQKALPVPNQQTPLGRLNSGSQPSTSQQNNLSSKGNSPNNPINVDGLAIVNTQKRPQLNNREAIFSNNRANMQSNTSNTIGNPNGSQTIQSVPNPRSVQNPTNSFGFSFNSFNSLQQNNIKPQNEFQKHPQNAFSSSSNTGFGPASAFPTRNGELYSNYQLPNYEGNWIKQYRSHPHWQQHHSKIAQLMRGNRMNDEKNIDLLAMMTFSSRQSLSYVQLQKKCQQILILSYHFEDSKANQSQLLSNRNHQFPNNQQDQMEIGFRIEDFSTQLKKIMPKDYSSYSQAEILALIEDEDIMNHYRRVSGMSVAKFVEQYNQFQSRSAIQLQQLTQATYQTFEKKRQIEKIYAEYEQQNKKNQKVIDPVVIDEIQEKQSEFYNLLVKVSSRLGRDIQQLPKNDLCYELQAVPKLEKEQARLNNEIQIWKTIHQEQQKGGPYKKVVDILCNHTSMLINKLKEIEEQLLPAFQSTLNHE